MLQNKLKKLSKNRAPIEHSSFVEKTSISTFFNNKIALHDKKVVLTGVEPDTGIADDGWSGSDEDPPTSQVHPHYLLAKQQHGIDRMTESEDSDYVYDPNVQGQKQNFPKFPLLPTINPILDAENQNLLDQINRNQQNNQINQNDQNNQNNQTEQSDFNENRNPRPKNNTLRKKFTYEPPTLDQQLRAQALNTLEWSQYLQDQKENDAVRAREYRQRKAAVQRRHRGADNNTSGAIHPKAAGDVNKNRPKKARFENNTNGVQRQSNNINKQNYGRPQARKPAPRRSGTLKNQLQNLEVKYKKRDERCKELEAQNKILIESARANFHFSNANRLSAIQVQKSKFRK